MDIKSSQLRKNILILSLLISVLPFVIFFFIDVGVENFWLKSANLFGFIGTVLIIWQFVLGIRGFIKRITPDYDWAIKIHTYLGIFGALSVFLHPILINIVYQKSFIDLFALNFSSTFNSFLSLGKLGFIIYLIVWITSSLARKLLSYRLWLYVHYLSYIMLFFVLLHPLQIGSILNSNTLVLNYWYFLILVSIVSIFLKILDIFNISFTKTKVEDITFFPGEIFVIKYKFVNEIPYLFPGQYFYIKNSFFGEAHPFSILDYSYEEKTITFGIKGLGKYTKKLMNTKIGDYHYIDGPFGEFTVQAQNENPKIILAGGIGITPFYRLIKDYGNDQTYLLYANQKIDFALYRDKFKELLKGNYYDFISHEKLNGKNIVCDFITTARIKEITTKLNNSETNFLICGSPIFTKSILECLKELKIPKQNILIEEFEY